MRSGLQALRCGKLDERDMRVFTAVSVVGMSPPNVFGGAEGTIIELHARCESSAKSIMFGSLLALAPRGSFEAVDLVWGTVAGADELPQTRNELRIFMELGADLNEDSDAQIVSLLLQHSGQIMMVESPTFYRAYAPAIAVLQGMAPSDLPFSEQIIHGLQEDDIGRFAETVDASIVLSSESEGGSKLLESMPMPLFITHLRRFSATHLMSNELTTMLDCSQSAAILTAMTRRLTIIQGPPGTGKSFTIVHLLRLLDSTSTQGPVLVLTYKNRSLEDILGGCMQAWPEGVARCGGAARPGSLLEHRHIKALLRNSRIRSKELDAAQDKAKKERGRVQEAAAKLSRARSFSAETICDAAFKDQLRSLFVHSPGSSSNAAMQVEEEEFDQLLASGDQVKLEAKTARYLSLWLPTKRDCAIYCRQASVNGADDERLKPRGHSQAEASEDRAQDRSMYRSFEEASVRFDSVQHASSREVLELLNPLSDGDVHHLFKNAAENIYNLSMADRVRLMNAMLRRRYSAWEQAYNKDMVTYNETLVELRRHDLCQQIKVLEKMKVVGMTISGASIYRDTIAALKPSHVLVEEAGEVLEPLLIAALGPWVKRLTLVGDHQQLPPSVENHQLAKGFDFNTSLMERLVNNKLTHVTLRSQARMMPEMARLLLDVYPTYLTSDRVDVKARCSPPPGTVKSVWWWDVREDVKCGGESLDPVSRSFVNHSEATAVVALIKHLVNSGVEASSITALASYSAQVALVQRRVEAEIGDDFGGRWPTASKEGIAAKNLLAALNSQIGGGGGGGGSSHSEAQLAQCVQVSETFLKLGELTRAKKALRLAQQIRRNDEVEANLECIAQLEKQYEKVHAFCQCTDADNARALINDAIDTLKQLEGLAVRWRSSGSSGIPAAAACCVLVQKWADEIEQAGNDVLSDGRKRLLNMVSQSSKKHISELASLNGVTFSSIDRYQGSENDVVIISLVRSNADGNIGFLCERARRIVAQSRARLGMYFVGDRQTFGSNEHWSRLTVDLQGCAQLGSRIPLCCPAHASCLKEISPDQASGVIQCGICKEPCGQLMSCGVHKCKRRCHGSGSGIDDLHMLCKEVVHTDVCTEGHAIRRRCFEAVSDVTCLTCFQVEKERREKAERERKALEEQTLEECKRLVREVRLQPPQLQKHDLLRHGADAVEYMHVVDRAERYAHSDHGNAISVSRIEKLSNPTLEAAFIQAKMMLKSGAFDCRSQQLFHGTGAEGIEGIPRTGFRLPAWHEDNMFGQALYFATDSSKSFQNMYTKGSGCLLLCDVLLGQACQIAGLEVRHPLSNHVKKSSKGRLYLDVVKKDVRAAGFDSVYASRGSRDKSGVQYDEMMVYDPAQAIPRYVLHIGGSGSKGQASWRSPAKRVSAGAMVRELKEKELGVTDSKELDEFNKAVGQYMRLMEGQSCHVKQVDVYESPAVEKAFNEKERAFKTAGKALTKVWVFHGTAGANIPQICAGGFQVGGSGGAPIANGAAHGNGVYTARGPATPMSYASRGGTKAVILSLALPGTTGAQGQADSWAPGDDWMIFKSGEQLWPRYVVHFD